MPHGRRLAAVVTGAALLSGCTPYYTDSSPASGEGRQLALVFLVVLLVPALLLGGVLAWYHLYSRAHGASRSPGLVWVAGAWCFLAALLCAWPAGWAILQLLAEAFGGADTLGEERVFLDFGWLLALVGGVSLCAALMVGTLGLSVLRGMQWARWTTVVVSALGFVAAVVGAVGSAGNQGNGAAVGLVLTLLAPVPIPFLLWWDASGHFAASYPSAPMPPPDPEPGPERQALADRWHTRG